MVLSYWPNWIPVEWTGIDADGLCSLWTEFVLEVEPILGDERDHVSLRKKMFLYREDRELLILLIAKNW